MPLQVALQVPAAQPHFHIVAHSPVKCSVSQQFSHTPPPEAGRDEGLEHVQCPGVRVPLVLQEGRVMAVGLQGEHLSVRRVNNSVIAHLFICGDQNSLKKNKQ